MNRPFRVIRTLSFVAVGLAVMTPLRAQNILVVEHKKKGAVVLAARGTRPIIEENGKRIIGEGNRYALHPIENIFPAFVAVHDLRVKTTAIQLMDTASLINNQFEFTGEFVSATPLKDVFLAMDLTFENGQRSIFIQEIGNLEARISRRLNVAFAMGYPLGSGRYEFHVFSEGVEVLNSMQPFDLRERLLDRLVAKYSAGQPDGLPRPFICPPPEYPAKLAKSKVAGHADVRIRVRTTGAVVDPVLTAASDPAFGDAAIAAVRQWRFIPAMKNGRATEMTVTLPVAFSPQEALASSNAPAANDTSGKKP